MRHPRNRQGDLFETRQLPTETRPEDRAKLLALPGSAITLGPVGGLTHAGSSRPTAARRITGRADLSSGFIISSPFISALYLGSGLGATFTQRSGQLATSG